MARCFFASQQNRVSSKLATRQSCMLSPLLPMDFKNQVDPRLHVLCIGGATSPKILGVFRVVNIDRMSASRNAQHRAFKIRGELFTLQCRRRYQHLQVSPASQRSLHQCKQNVSVHTSFVCFIQHDDTVCTERWVLRASVGLVTAANQHIAARVRPHTSRQHRTKHPSVKKHSLVSLEEQSSKRIW